MDIVIPSSPDTTGAALTPVINAMIKTPEDPKPIGFNAEVKSDLDPAMWDIVYEPNQKFYVYTQKATGRVVAAQMADWKAMLKQELPNA